MRAPFLLTLLLLPLLAGCLESPPPAADEGGRGVDALPSPPTLPTSLPTLPPSARLLYERAHAFLEPREDVVTVPPETGELWFQARVQPGVGAAVSVTLLAPDGAIMATCREGACHAQATDPAGGDWRIAYAGVSTGEATVRVHVAPRGLPVTPLPPTSPPPVPPTQETSARQTAYARAFDFDAFRYVPFDNDTFVVPPGWGRAYVNVTSRASGDAVIRILDAANVTVGECPMAREACGMTLDARAGLWQVIYDGKATGGAEVQVVLLADARPPPADPVQVFRQVHTYAPQHPWNRTSGFWVPGGYARMDVEVRFSRSAPASPGDDPVVRLLDPAGEAVLTCRLSEAAQCKAEVGPSSGLWRVWYLGPATGAVLVRAEASVPWSDPPAPTQPPAPDWRPQPGERMLHRNMRALDRDFEVVDVASGVERLRMVVEANGTFDGRVDLVAPDGTVHAACTDPCERVVLSPPEGRWRIAFTREVGAEVGVTVLARPRA